LLNGLSFNIQHSAIHHPANFGLMSVCDRGRSVGSGIRGPAKAKSWELETGSWEPEAAQKNAGDADASPAL
jgi:hypothetical protein